MSSTGKSLAEPVQSDLDMFFPPLSAEMEEEAIRLGREQVAAGQTVDAEAVIAWVASWGTPNETPPPI
jgi:hypothetical protein